MQVMQEKHFNIDVEAAKGASNVKAFLVLGFQLVAGYDPTGVTDGCSSSLHNKLVL